MAKLTAAGRIKMDGKALRVIRIWLTASALLLIAAVWFFAHYRGRAPSIADPGFASVYPPNTAPRSLNRVEPVISSKGQLITLDPTGRFLINSITHKPIFITGDDAWSLITALDDADVEIYLSDRAARGFNYIWCAAADNHYQAHPSKNYYGDSPFDGSDFTHEDPKYWAHVDYVIHRAAAHGITVALDPGFVGLTTTDGYLASYQNTSDALLTAYGAFLGERYKDAPNLIWALGGDVDPNTGVVPKLTNLALGIRSKDTVHLMTAEGQPKHAALDTFPGATWLNLNWLYFHATGLPGGASGNYSRTPWLPSFLGETWYENDSPLSELQIREQGYWGVLSGAYLGNGGFGNSPLWYFSTGPHAKPNDPGWKTQLGSEGSLGQMYLGKLFRSREHWKLAPDLDHKVMTAGYDSRPFLSKIRESLRALARSKPYRLGSESSVAARTADGQTVIAYIPIGNATTVSIAMESIADSRSQARCWWFNPRDGSSSLIGLLPARGTHNFTPPDAKDWVLVIDSQEANLPAPGSANLQGG
jgi:Protein of unknown function (DUF4038)/Putative collagen-binding domain of a collagenase